MKKKTENIYKEVKKGDTIFRLKSVFEGDKDLKKILEKLAVKKAANY